MSEEFEILKLKFVYLKIDSDEHSVIEYISFDSKLLNQIKKIAGVSIVGKSVPLTERASEGIQSIREDKPVFCENFTGYLKNLFGNSNNNIRDLTLKMSGFTKDTSGIFLPLRLGDDSTHLIIIWGDLLKESDIKPLLIYKTQMESIFESARLFSLAEKEIQERRITQEALYASQKEYRGLFESAHDAIIISDPSTSRILDANERALSMFEYDHDEFIKIRLESITQNPVKLKEIISKIINTENHFSFELIQFKKNNRVPMEMEVNAGIVIYNDMLAIQSIHRDVTQRKRMEERLRHDALHDSLTNLPNRILFLDRLEQLIIKSSQSKTYSFAVLYLDLDRFKDINDTLGHLVGDKLLVDLSERLSSHMHATDTIARMGGDEFALIIEDFISANDIKNFCERIINLIKQPFTIKGNEIRITASIGIVISAPSYNNPEEYLRDADIAMFKAKAQRKDNCAFFDVSMRTSIIKRMEIENKLCKAIENEKFFLVYQPIINLVDKVIIGFEVLLRWQDFDNGLIPPLEFIPIAEDMGIIHEIGQWVLEKACSQVHSWQMKHNHKGQLKLNVNVSAVQLLRSDFPEEVLSILKSTNFDPSNLALEITETAFINDQQLAINQIENLKALGVEIHLDDFGTGYSSLSFINLFQVDALKIEGQFISRINQDKKAGLVRAIIALGENMGLDIIAEGIETKGQHKFLMKAGCKIGQGSYFSKPINSEEAALLVVSNRKANQKIPEEELLAI